MKKQCLRSAEAEAADASVELLYLDEKGPMPYFIVSRNGRSIAPNRKKFELKKWEKLS